MSRRWISCGGSARRSITAMPGGSTSCARRRPTRRAPSCSPSTMSRTRSGSRRWCAQHFPDLPIYARARDRIHVHKLMDLGVTIIERETFLSALELTRRLLRGLGLERARGEAADSRPSSGRTRSAFTRTTNITRTWRRSAPTRSRRRWSSRSCSPATWKSSRLEAERAHWRRAGDAGDHPVYRGRMGERAHMAAPLSTVTVAFGKNVDGRDKSGHDEDIAT